jgi:hypothetical protein
VSLREVGYITKERENHEEEERGKRGARLRKEAKARKN